MDNVTKIPTNYIGRGSGRAIGPTLQQWHNVYWHYSKTQGFWMDKGYTSKAEAEKHVSPHWDYIGIKCVEIEI